MLNLRLHGFQAWIEHVRIISERRDAHTVLRAERIHVIGLALREVRHIDMRDACVFALCFADWPAHDLHT